MIGDTTHVSIITDDLTDGDFEIDNDLLTERLNEVKAGIKATAGVECVEVRECEGSFDLSIDAPTAGLNALVDRLNDVDGVRLAHYRDGFGQMYPNI